MPVQDRERLSDEPRLLLVEGQDDFYVISALCEVGKIPENFVIFDCGSDEDVLNALNTLLLRSDLPEIIGVVIDADKPDVSCRWQSIQDKLQNYPYVLPNEPERDGTIIEGVEDMPRLGFWLMPNNVDPGMLEDFCWQLAPDNAIAFAEHCVTEAKEKLFATFRDVHQSKAVVHTYLAWQDEPGKPLGQSIKAKALTPEIEIAKTFTSWLQRLFDATNVTV